MTADSGAHVYDGSRGTLNYVKGNIPLTRMLGICSSLDHSMQTLTWAGTRGEEEVTSEVVEVRVRSVLPSSLVAVACTGISLAAAALHRACLQWEASISLPVHSCYNTCECMYLCTLLSCAVLGKSVFGGRWRCCAAGGSLGAAREKLCPTATDSGESVRLKGKKETTASPQN